MSTWAIVLAAGSGQRFGARKQFEPLGPRRLVDWAVASVAACDGIVVVLPAGTIWDGAEVDVAVPGGATHAASTLAGLEALPSDAETVVITAASHPFAGADLVQAVTDAVTAGADAAAPLLPLSDAVKVVDDADVIRSVDTGTRPMVAQLPFAFRRLSLEAAMRRFPDVAEELAAIEADGGRIARVEGRPDNLHVATPADLDVARRLVGDD